MKFYNLPQRKHVTVPDSEVRYYTKVIKNGTRKITFAKHGKMTKIVKNEATGKASTKTGLKSRSPKRRVRSKSPKRSRSKSPKRRVRSKSPKRSRSKSPKRSRSKSPKRRR